MRLRFREAAIKRLEGVASAKISAETHLLKEKEEHLKELEVLRSHVDRNQDVTRFAMENLRLKEEIRRLKTFYEEGEQERMNEQLMILEDKLLEALDWKLMHESEPSHVKKPSFDFMTDSQRDGDFFSLKDPVTPRNTEKKQFEFPLVTTPTVTHVSDQRELQTMVDAIAAASQREAEAHETAIILSKENDQLKIKLKMLIDDNNKLIELYEKAAADGQQIITRAEENQNEHVYQTVFTQKELEWKTKNENLEHQLEELHEENDRLLGLYEKVTRERNEVSQKELVDQTDFAQKLLEMKKKNENLELQLVEMHEENDKLLELYEKVMQERNEESQKDDVQTTSVQKELVMTKHNERLEQQLVEMHEENDKLLGLYEKAMHERDELRKLFSAGEQKRQVHEGNETEIQMDGSDLLDGNNLVEVNVREEHSQCSSQTSRPSTTPIEVQMVEKLTFCDERKHVDDIDNLLEKFDKAQETLSKSSESVGLFRSLEREIIDIDRLSRNIQKVKGVVLIKQRDCMSTNLVRCDLHERENTLERKLTALRHSMSTFCKSLGYFEQREGQARARSHAASSHLKSKQKELTHLQSIKDEAEGALLKIKQSELELRNRIATLKIKMEEEKKKRENDKVLLAVENVEWQLTGKATELLKSEEEKTKLQLQMNEDEEKLETNKKESEKMTRKLQDLHKKMQVAEVEIQKWEKVIEEIENKLESNIEEKETVLGMKEVGKTEFEKLFIDYQESRFAVKLKEEEMKILSGEMEIAMKREAEMECERSRRLQKMVEETRGGLLSDKLVGDLENICSSFLELRSLLHMALS